MAFVSKKKKHHLAIPHEIANVFWQQFDMCIGISSCAVPIHFLVAWCYDDYAPWLIYNHPWKELDLYHAAVFLGLGIVLPLLWTTTFVFGIALTQQYATQKKDSFTSVLTDTLKTSLRIISTVWQWIFIFSVTGFTLQQLSQYACAQGSLSPYWIEKTKTGFMLLLFLLALEETYYYSVVIPCYLSHMGSFRQALAEGKALAAQEYGKVRTYGFLFLGILSMVPLFFYGLAWLVDWDFYAIFDNVYHRLAWITLFYTTFLLYSLAHGVLFTRLYENPEVKLSPGLA